MVVYLTSSWEWVATQKLITAREARSVTYTSSIKNTNSELTQASLKHTSRQGSLDQSQGTAASRVKAATIRRWKRCSLSLIGTSVWQTNCPASLEFQCLKNNSKPCSLSLMMKIARKISLINLSSPKFKASILATKSKSWHQSTVHSFLAISKKP